MYNLTISANADSQTVWQVRLGLNNMYKLPGVI